MESGDKPGVFNFQIFPLSAGFKNRFSQTPDILSEYR